MIIPKLSLLLIFVTNVISGPTKIFDEGSLLVFDEDKLHDAVEFLSTEYDIVNIVVPHNDLLLNVYGATEPIFLEDGTLDNDMTLFFFEADHKQDSTDFKGLSVLYDGKVKKLLENGRDAVSGEFGTKDVFIAATDGLYSYDSENNEAKKYGSINDNLIAITKVQGSDILYVLNNKNELLKVTEKGTKTELVSGVKNAKQIAHFADGTLLYVDDKNDVYAMKNTGISKIPGLPESIKSLKLLRPLVLEEIDHVAVVIVDNTLYFIDDETVLKVVELKVVPTTIAMDLLFVQYIGLDKKLYLTNALYPYWDSDTAIALGTLTQTHYPNHYPFQK